MNDSVCERCGRTLEPENLTLSSPHWLARHLAEQHTGSFYDCPCWLGAEDIEIICLSCWSTVWYEAHAAYAPTAVAEGQTR